MVSEVYQLYLIFREIKALQEIEENEHVSICEFAIKFDMYVTLLEFISQHFDAYIF